ncbi:hypothetical protein [Methylocystis hirsuta]|uniref:Uncharacterized protein n=1 Tax=Methylocystis hirsuta TaxID=369798 RepID=A0A3M9XN30_9HYPH|nr:hypothetical protein [Methylocystis hirsuta]RNJ49142.1 hypothetical protein D1O30_05555 [Methylocystis hirsuta]
MMAQDILSIAANIAQITTALVAVIAYGSYRWAIFKRRKRIEDYLWTLIVSPPTRNDPRERTVDDLMTALGLSKEEALRAVFSSKVINRDLRNGSGPVTSRIWVSHIDRNPQN